MSWGAKLLSAYPEAAQNIMHRYFEWTDIEMHLNAGPYDPDSELVKTYDVVIKCIGSS